MKLPASWNSEKNFEIDVLRVARLLWPNANIAGPIVLDERERDGVFVTDDGIHIIECTTSRGKTKAEEDVDKSIKLARQLRRQYPGRAVQCWFITAEEPTGDQRGAISKRTEFPVKAESYDQFRGKLIDASSYLLARSSYAFGSARNLRDGSPTIGKDEYVNLDILRLNDTSVFSVESLTKHIADGKLTRAILLGDYGAGKSMTLRQLHLQLEEVYRSGTSSRFPIILNLRDHNGQSDPVEALERHARKIGFSRPDHLVRAWRAGYAHLLLDGFDELSSTGWMAFNKRLRQVRYSTVELIRRFINETPTDVLVCVSGRASYFDDVEECLNALGLKKDKASIFSLNDFSEDQIKKYFQKFGQLGAVPDWLPSRPLLIGYLLVHGALNNTVEKWADNPGKGWDIMLSQICDREARTHESVDSQTVRHIVEKLASLARAKGGLTAPLAVTDMSAAFQAAVGIPPDERAETLLMRLPGVGAYDRESHEQRSFIDQEFASAAAAGDVWRYIQNPYDPTLHGLIEIKEVLPATGIEVVVVRMLEEALPSEQVYVAFRRAVEEGDGEIPRFHLSTDVFKVILTGEIGPPRAPLRATIKSILLDELDLTSVPDQVGGVTFQDSLIVNLYLSSEAKDDNDLPGFLRTEFNHIEGRTGAGDLPANKFIGCGLGTFSESFTTNAAVIDLSVEPGLKALVTVLRKLFVQKGAGRKENAFYRGVSGVSSSYITEALRLVEGAAFAAKSKRGSGDPIWTPNRRMSARVNAILVAPSRSTESIVIAAKQTNH